MEYTKGSKPELSEAILSEIIFNRFRFNQNDIETFPDKVMALTDSGAAKLVDILPFKYKAAPDMYEALKALIEAYNIETEDADEIRYLPEYWQKAVVALNKVEGKKV